MSVGSRARRVMVLALALALSKGATAIAQPHEFTCSVEVADASNATPLRATAVRSTAEEAKTAARNELCARFKSTSGVDCADDPSLQIDVETVNESVSTTGNGKMKREASVTVVLRRKQKGSATETAPTRAAACRRAAESACAHIHASGVCEPGAGWTVISIDGIPVDRFLRCPGGRAVDLFGHPY